MVRLYILWENRMSKIKFEMRLLNDPKRNNPKIPIEDMMLHINNWLKLYGDKSYVEFLSKNIALILTIEIVPRTCESSFYII